jgi:hypothetical protein
MFTDLAASLIPVEEFNREYASKRVELIKIGIAQINKILAAPSGAGQVVILVDKNGAQTYRDLLQSRGYKCAITNSCEGDVANTIRLNIILPSDNEILSQSDIDVIFQQIKTKLTLMDVCIIDVPEQHSDILPSRLRASGYGCTESASKIKGHKQLTVVNELKTIKNLPSNDTKNNNADIKENTNDTNKDNNDTNKDTKNNNADIKENTNADIKEDIRYKCNKESLDDNLLVMYNYITAAMVSRYEGAFHLFPERLEKLCACLRSEGYCCETIGSSLRGIVILKVSKTNKSNVTSELDKMYNHIKDTLKMTPIYVVDVKNDIWADLYTKLRTNGYECQINVYYKAPDASGNWITKFTVSSATVSIEVITNYFKENPEHFTYLGYIDIDNVPAVESHFKKLGYKVSIGTSTIDKKQCVYIERLPQVIIKASAVFEYIKKDLDNGKSINATVDTDISETLREMLLAYDRRCNITYLSGGRSVLVVENKNATKDSRATSFIVELVKNSVHVTISDTFPIDELVK